MRCGSAQATAERGFEDGKILDGGENNRESYISCAGEGEKGGGGGMRRSTKAAVQQAMRVRSREASER